MFSKDVNLEKLINQQNVEITAAVKGQGEDENGKKFYQVEASGTLYDPDKTGDRGPLITKRVVISAIDTELEKAQDRALEKVQKLLGV